MSILSDMKDLKDLSKKARDINIDDIDSPEDLRTVIQQAKDISDQYLFELGAIPGRMDRYLDVLRDLGIYTGSTDFEDLAKSTFLGKVKEGAVADIDDTQVKLAKAMAEIEASRMAQTNLYDIGGVSIDFLYSPNPSEATEPVSQPIVSSKNIDRANEDAEHKNTTISATVVLVGEDRMTRLNQIRQLRKDKKIIKAVFKEVYEQLLITGINPKFDSSDSIEVDISFENLFIQALQRTSEPVSYFKQPTRKKSTAGQQGTRYLTQSDWALTQA